MSRIATSLIVVAVFALSACEVETEVAESEERVRAIKTFTVTQPAGGQTRSFSGSLAAAATSSLSFSVGGSTTKVNVTAGDSVQAGDVLAELDPEPLMLDVDAARSGLAGAQAAYDEKLADVNRQRTLYEKGWLAKAGLDQALAAFEVADMAVQVHGGLGYAEGFPIERIFRDTRGGMIPEGTSEIQTLIAGREILGISAIA